MFRQGIFMWWITFTSVWTFHRIYMFLERPPSTGRNEWIQKLRITLIPQFSSYELDRSCFMVRLVRSQVRQLWQMRRLYQWNRFRRRQWFQRYQLYQKRQLQPSRNKLCPHLSQRLRPSVWADGVRSVCYRMDSNYCTFHVVCRGGAQLLWVRFVCDC